MRPASLDLIRCPRDGRPLTRDGDELTCERIYFDTLTMLRQLLGGLNLRSPRSWALVIRALRGLSAMSREPHPSLVDTPKADLT